MFAVSHPRHNVDAIYNRELALEEPVQLSVLGRLVAVRDCLGGGL